ncbi:MAG: alpha/beta fold hydrolase [Pseudomonadota bacterium]
MAERARVQRIEYDAPILGGYGMSAQVAPARHAPWRVIGIPGTPSRPHMWSRFVRLAPDDLEVAAVNRAGYGGPMYGDDRRAPVLSFDDQIAAIAPLIEADERPAVVVGVSYGGALALKAALDHPERIKGVVTVAALVTEPLPWIEKILPLAELPPVRAALPGYLRNARAEVEGRRAQVEAVFERLKGFDRPATIMHGNVDWLVGQSDAEVLRGYFAPDADVVYQPIAGGTHYLELLNPRTVYGAIRDVIARAEGGGHTSRVI